MKILENPYGLDMSNRPTRGFALIVTLSLMILLTVIAVGLLTLSSISLRSSSQGEAMQIARANARLAMMMAIGDLQKLSGKDTRITARADILVESNPPVVGVWKSWEGTDHEITGSAQGRPVAPDYAGKSTRFVGWLTSNALPPKNTINDLPNTKGGGAGKVALLGANSVGTEDPDKRQIYLDPTLVNLTGQKGAYAWWVSGENQKARLPKPYAPDSQTAASWSVLAKSHASVDPKPFGLDVLLTDPSVSDATKVSPGSKSVSLKQADLIAGGTPGPLRKSQEFFHDLSATSVGLLTNSATGGWRKDLSLATENWDNLPVSNLPLFRVSPESDLQYSRATSSDPYADRSILYPWTTYRGSSGTANPPIYRFPAIGTWTNLANYAKLYNKASSTSGAMQFNMKAVKIDGNAYEFTHEPRLLPVIARLQWVFAHRAKLSATPGKYDLEAVINPVITLWNPYNVILNTTSNLTFTLVGSLPPVIDYKIDGASRPKKFTLQGSSMTGTTQTEAVGMYPGPVTYTLPMTLSLKPGETQVFSANGATNNLKPGYVPTDGVPYSIGKAVGNTASPGGGGTITTGMTFDSEYSDISPGVGLYLDMGAVGVGGRVLAYRMIYDKTAAQAFYPAKPASKFPSYTLSELLNAPKPFLAVTFGARMASNTHLSSKGFVQSSPFVNYTAMGKKALVESTIQWAYPGVNHNVNSPFEYSFQGLTPGSTFLPNVDKLTNRGYIVTGFQASDGLSRCVIDELPGRPLHSLGELQNWDARYENPVPPYAFNLVGNSDATPLIGQKGVVNAAEVAAKGGQNLQNDDSYCLNHLLFDDWFFSSIAPEPAAFGQASSSSTLQNTYKNFLTNPAKPLANRSYKAVPQDVADPTAAVTKNVSTPATSWKTIASRLEVEGMFNVNSVSVTAWRALLGHARNQKIPYMDSSGSPQLSGESDYAMTRFSVSGDVESKKNGSSGAKADSAEYAGYRTFTGSQLDFLAQEIVNQVRLRGPFLSLSEFVNRQLSSNDSLALAGAVQTALNQLSAGSQDPFKTLKINLTPETPNYASENPPGAATGYQFSKAALGYNIYGIPGWTRQADLLRPIAPILSARDDTFTIRCYGDARDRNGKIQATAVCEATVCRSKNFVDPSDDSALADLSNNSGVVVVKKITNQVFGRRYELISLRWLAAGEI